MATSDRSIDDRFGEALRRYHFGLVRPLWADMPADEKATWAGRAKRLREGLFAEVGLEFQAAA
jgi:hypothetical protein